LTQRGVGLFCDPRTGKTWIALALIEQLAPQDALLVVPLTNKTTTWVKLIAELLPDYTACLTWDAFKKAKGKKRILLAHYELLPSLITKALRIKWGIVILDESQRIKARASRQSRNLRRLRHVEQRVALSGTPMDDSEIDLWGQMRFIEPAALSDVWDVFDRNFLKPSGFMGYGRKFREEMRLEFNRRIAPYCLRISRDEAGIPDPELVWQPVPLLGRQASLYADLERDWVVSVEGHSIETTMEITNRVKLQQVCNGFIFNEAGDHFEVGQAKLRRLRFLLKHRVSSPVIIFCQYLPEVPMIADACRAYSSRVGVLTGAVKDRKSKPHRSNLIRSFQAGELDYLICQQKTGGVGIDLYRARDAIVYSFNESFIDFDQMKSRMDVQGNDPPTIFLIYAQGTIDEVKKEAVLSKRSFNEVILNRFKHRR
jgi:SNF2 family DNA or RNA helicase